MAGTGTSDRLDAFFAEQADGLCHRDYWGALAGIWRSSDAAGRRDPRWDEIWKRAALAPGAREGLMDAQEREAFDRLSAAERERSVALFLVDGEPELVVRPGDER